MKLADFRRHLLAALHAASAQASSGPPGAQARLHLLYAPELSDPLMLAADARRDKAVIHPPVDAVDWPRETCPFLVTLDCRRVAPYLLETDPGFDDPLLEASIAQAHAETFEGQRICTEITNDDPGLAEAAVCAWILTPEPAALAASRINRHASLFNSQNRRRWVRWYQPACIGMLWPTLVSMQREALLGPGTWFAHDAVGRLQRFRSDEPACVAPYPEAAQGARHLSVAQWNLVDNARVVAELARRWAAVCAGDGLSLPHDAERRLGAHVGAARSLGLDTEDLGVYVLLAVQLLDGAMQSPAVVGLVSEARDRGRPLRDHVRSLPDSFWACYLPMHATPEQALRAATSRLA